MVRLLLCALLLPLACARAKPPRSDDLRVELRLDRAAPERPSDAPSDHALSDRALPPRLTCAPPGIVGDGYPPQGTSLAESALAADGLRIYAWCSEGRCRASRVAVGDPFGAWSAAPELPFGQDPAFFTHLGQAYLVVARSASNTVRRLDLCTWPSLACTPLPVHDAVGEIGFDMDGPSVAVVGGRVLLAHNIGVGGADTADLFLGEPLDPSDLRQGFLTEAISAINQPSRKEDDPALSPDGLVLIFSAESGAGETLWVSQRTSLADPFPVAELLGGVGSNAKGACLGALPQLGGKARYELFFESTRSGKTMIYRSICER